MSLDRLIPPQNLDAEKAVLGCLLMDCADFDEVVALIGGVESFYTPAHREIYQRVVDLHETGDPIDLVVFEAWLNKCHVDGIPELRELAIECAESFADLANAQHYARIVRGCADRRDLIRVGQELAAAACDDANEPAELIAKFSGRLEAVQGPTKRGDVIDGVDLVRQLPAAMDDSSRQFVPTGLTVIDVEMSGLERGSLTILAARPSVGKTALGLGFALNAASAQQEGCPALFVSVEMPRLAIAARLVGLLTHANVSNLRSGVMSDSDRQRAVDEATRLLARGRLYVIDSISNVGDIVGIARQHVRRGVGLVVVDYLQLCQPAGRAENRNLAVASMSAAFKRLAQQTGAAVVVCSQLSRDHEKSGRKPTLGDLRDSGAIEQDADVVMFLHRGDDANGYPTPVELLVRKNRNGRTFEGTLAFYGQQMWFENWTTAPSANTATPSTLFQADQRRTACFLAPNRCGEIHTVGTS